MHMDEAKRGNSGLHSKINLLDTFRNCARKYKAKKRIVIVKLHSTLAIYKEGHILCALRFKTHMLISVDTSENKSYLAPLTVRW